MKILIHSMVFSPDGVSTAYLYNDIAVALKNAGNEVVILTTTPHFNRIEEQMQQQPLRWGVWGLYKRSVYKDMPVYHVPQKKFKNTLLRLIGFVYWHVVSFFIGLSIRNVDVILSPSPPLTIGRVNQMLAWFKKSKIIYNVQEIYPDILGKEGTLIHKLLSRMEKKVYDGSDAVTTIDKVFYDTISGRFKDKGKLHIIHNFVDTDLYRPEAPIDMLDRGIFPSTDSIKLLYAGNIGYAQDWDTLVRLAQKTSEADVEYFVIGEGVMKLWLEEQKHKLNLKNVHLIPYMPRYLMPNILSYSDIQFIFMTPEMEAQGFPSKVYTIMACGKPLLIGSGENTPIVDFLSPIGCAKIVCEHDVDRKVEQMAAWLSAVNRDELRKMGQSGIKVIQENYSKEIVTSKYVSLINNI